MVVAAAFFLANGFAKLFESFHIKFSMAKVKNLAGEWVASRELDPTGHAPEDYLLSVCIKTFLRLQREWRRRQLITHFLAQTSPFPT